ncbi:MAG: hypothetical protein EBR82_82525, partial [Caulobacteraceae bacterium]|nr:hypothetical protein [Caulobacteraceae bacterium]
DNRSRAFDPKYISSPYYGSIVPRRRIIFSILDSARGYNFTQFTGWIDDWNLSYDVSGDSTSTAQCSDAFTILANQNVTLTSPTAELSGDRIRRVLNSSSVAWPAELTKIYPGNFTMGTASYSGNALDYLQSVSDSEAGTFFVDNNGKLTFLDWNTTKDLAATQYLTFSSSPGTAYMPIQELEVEYGTEELVNNVTVTSAAGTVTVQDTTSQQTYRIASESYPVLTSNLTQMTTLANFYITNYATPRYRVSKLKVSLDDARLLDYVSPSTYFGWGTLLLVQLGYGCLVNWIPNNIGTAITQQAAVIGVDLYATPESCTITYSIAGEDTRSYV